MRDAIFKGILFAADFNKNFLCRTIVLADVAESFFGSIGTMFQKMNKFRDPLIKMEDVKFEYSYMDKGVNRMTAQSISKSSNKQKANTLKSIKPVLMMLLVAVMGCKPDVKSDSTAADSTVMEEHALNVIENLNDSLHVVPETTLSEEEAAQYFMKPDQFLVDTQLDTSEFQVITTTCAIIVEKTQASIKQREEAEEQEEAERQARREKMSDAELAHDDSVREEEESIMGDDGMYYNSLKIDGLETLAILKIKTIAAQDKGYLKLVDANKKEWVLDIRGSMEQGWTAVIFNIKKEPKVIDLTNVNRDAVIRYFLYE